MKLFGLILRCLAVGVIWSIWAPFAQAQAPDIESFPGVKKALTPEQFASAGLGKLSPAEQAKLDEFLKGYFTGASQRVAEQAASQAVDRAVKERKVQAPTLIESHIVGTFRGWTEKTVFALDNGQRWKVNDGAGRGSFAPVENPQVYILRDSFGFKMAILGGGVVRVHRL